MSLLYTHDPASVRPSFTISKIFFSETTWTIKLKFYMEPPWVVALKFCSRYFGHTTKLAATPYMVKTLQKSSSLEPAGRFPRNLVASGTPAHHSLLNDDPGMTLTYFTARSILET